MQIKAWYCLTSELVYHRIINKEHIKSIIRICGQSQTEMVVSQLQALIVVSEGLHGKKLYLNFDKLKERLTSGMQDLFTMLIFNESVLTKRIGQQNISRFKQVLNLSSFANGKVVK